MPRSPRFEDRQGLIRAMAASATPIRSSRGRWALRQNGVRRLTLCHAPGFPPREIIDVEGCPDYIEIPSSALGCAGLRFCSSSSESTLLVNVSSSPL